MSKKLKERYSLREFWRDRVFFEVPISQDKLLDPANLLQVEELEADEEDGGHEDARYFGNPYLEYAFVPGEPGMSLTFNLFSGLVHLDGLKLSQGIRLATFANKLNSKRFDWEVESAQSMDQQVSLRVNETSFTFQFDKSKADFLLVEAVCDFKE